MAAVGDQRAAACLRDIEGERRERWPGIRRAAARGVAADLAKHPRGDRRLEVPRRGGETPHHRHRQHALRRFGGGEHRVAIGHARRERFFHQHVQPRPQQRLRRLAVKLRRQRDDRGFGMIGSGGDGGRDVRNAELRGDGAGAGFVAVDQDCDDHRIAGERAGQVAQLGDRPAPDDSDANRFASGLWLGPHRPGFWQQVPNKQAGSGRSRCVGKAFCAALPAPRNCGLGAR